MNCFVPKWPWLEYCVLYHTIDCWLMHNKWILNTQSLTGFDQMCCVFFVCFFVGDIRRGSVAGRPESGRHRVCGRRMGRGKLCLQRSRMSIMCIWMIILYITTHLLKRCPKQMMSGALDFLKNTKILTRKAIYVYWPECNKDLFEIYTRDGTIFLFCSFLLLLFFFFLPTPIWRVFLFLSFKIASLTEALHLRWP